MLRKKILFAAIAVFTMALASGCHFYVEDGGDGDGDGDWTDRGPNPGDDCSGDTDCAEGCYCDTGTCVETGFCGDGWTCEDAGLPDYVCDDRDTCVPDDGPVACDDATNPCDDGQVCGDDGVCADKTCDDITDEQECLDAVDCSAVYTGINCTDPTGAPCSAEEANCTCETFNFRLCEDTPTEN